MKLSVFNLSKKIYYEATKGTGPYLENYFKRYTNIELEFEYCKNYSKKILHNILK